MKVVVAGRGSLAVRGAALFALLGSQAPHPVELVCVPGRDDGAAGSQRRDDHPSLRAAARENGWSLAENVAQAGTASGDLLVSLQFDRIVSVDDVGGARAVNLHFALLPRHRGSLTSYWPIAERDGEVGVTLHELTAEIDAGPVIASRSFPLPPWTTSQQLHETYHREAFELLTEQAPRLLADEWTSVPQGPAAPAHRRSDVDLSVREISDFTTFDQEAPAVRAACLSRISPAHQLPRFRGRDVIDAVVVEPREGSGSPGEVLARTAASVLVRCAQGCVVLELASAPPAGR